MPSRGAAGEGQVADRVEDLVTDELVGVAQALGVDHPVLADGDGVLERGAEREAGAPQLLHVAHEAEGAGAGDLAAEDGRRQIDRLALAADHRGGEIDLHVEAEAALVGEQFREGLALGDANGLQNLQVAAARVLGDDADLVDGVDERSRAAVEDRHFGPVDLDQNVVDAEARKSGHQVLDRGRRRRSRGRR